MSALDDRAAMALAIERASSVRVSTSPNPWVGAVLVADGVVVGTGATEPPGGRHAEVVALGEAGTRARGATLYVTLEPCSHHGRTPPCIDAVIAAGVERVVVGVLDPDTRVAGSGVAALRAAGLVVDIVEDEVAAEVEAQLAPYLHHRRTGRPYVVCKLAASLDGGIAAPDGSSQWITGLAARTDAHRLRAESDAILVGAGTVRADDPSLTVRLVEGPDPRRVVLGRAPAAAKVHPCLEWTGDERDLLDRLGADGVLQVMIEGGSTVVRNFHGQGLVDRYVVYVAPALFGGRDQFPMLGGPTSSTIDDLWRGRFVDVRRLGDDLRVDVVPVGRAACSRGEV
ncbi:MAG: diaminohydroxyphosphoribosylaminopyrimidine deaminase [Actinomycetota bacterium]